MFRIAIICAASIFAFGVYQGYPVFVAMVALGAPCAAAGLLGATLRRFNVIR